MNSRFPIAEIIKNLSAQSVIKKFNKIFSIFRYPKKVLTDNRHHTSKWFIKIIFEFLNIKHVAKLNCKITPHYSQVNGMIEKFMRVLSKAIKMLVYENRNWKNDLHEVLCNYKSSIHARTRYFPAHFFSINH